MIPHEVFQQAYEKIRVWSNQKRLIQKTPVSFDSELGIYLKWENQQTTGSFKVRGALNKILSLPEYAASKGLVTASAGNHGQGVALAAGQFRYEVIVFASEHAVEKKLNAMRSLGAQIRLVPGGYEEAEKAAIDYATLYEKTWISPYNDIEVIAGQATIAYELVEQIQPFDIQSVLVPVGGGGLVAGIASAMEYMYEKDSIKKPKILAIQSEASAYFHDIYYLGSQDAVVETDSLADGLSGRVENGSITIPLVKKYVDDVILVSESEIAEAIRYAWYQYNQVIEGSAATVLAAILNGSVKMRPAVLVISGGNIQPTVHTALCSE